MARKTDAKPGTAGGLLAQWDEPVPADVIAACEEAVDAFECKDLEIKDRVTCSCCGASSSDWEHCDLCGPKICTEEGHDYIYDRANRRHSCRHCDQEPPPDWYDIFSD